MGSLTLFHGNTSPLVASGTEEPVEFDSTSSPKSSGFSPAQGHSVRSKRQYCYTFFKEFSSWVFKIIAVQI